MILSHLDYPLAWVIDEFKMRDVGATEGTTPRTEFFVRTAGLVDISLREDRIIFVASTKTKSEVTLGGIKYLNYAQRRLRLFQTHR